MVKKHTPTRRDVLRVGAGTLPVLAGSTMSVSARNTANDRETHEQLHDDLDRLKQVWRMNAERQLNEWSKELENQALNAVDPTPGLADLLPGPVSELKTLTDQMVVTSGFMESTSWMNARRKFRTEWEKQDGYDHSLQKHYYTELGYSVENPLVANSDQSPPHPYLAIYMSPIRGLKNVLTGEIGYGTLETRGSYVNALLEQQLLPHLPNDDDYEQALYANLQTLAKLGTAVENLAAKHL